MLMINLYYYSTALASETTSTAQRFRIPVSTPWPDPSHPRQLEEEPQVQLDSFKLEKR